MTITLLTQVDWLIRLIIAGICGYAIGYERNSRSKNAGIRTHLIVSLSAALMIIVSKYGFMDIINLQGVGLDPSRVAAQVVSGIGFLGAGMIFVHNQSVNGLTTAAGIWATSGIGMAIGSGLYFIGVAATLLIIIFQIILHQNFRWTKAAVNDHLHLKLADMEGFYRVQDSLKENKITLLNLKLVRHQDGTFSADLNLKFPTDYDSVLLLKHLEANDKIQKIEF
ncbi:MgtC/SapB family protein [Lactococcus taiwanensis]|uniref:MgtC/SapB family protein n=1 Tax=Lactococcus taiwanensis TaxID=1151742 RepID=A0AA45KF98_9LACT|nr:MgtC/SapB family protein [Lactococcus taiwanensis]KZK37653.1 Mg(2+) transport ATPase protein C [Lactococcus cremoris]QRZ11250.1 MgtC/SapB family protein [Lactococcus taiwanensis]QSE76285.1 MgtC/SapB family protein [Lactococcus taiwanensis]